MMGLDRGKLMEYASPSELLNDPQSIFYALCKKTGALEELKEMARAADVEYRRQSPDVDGGDAS